MKDIVQQKKVWNEDWMVRMKAFSAFKMLLLLSMTVKTFASESAAKSFWDDFQQEPNMRGKELKKFLNDPYSSDYIKTTKEGGKKWADGVAAKDIATLNLHHSMCIGSDVYHDTLDNNHVAQKMLFRNGKYKHASELISGTDAGIAYLTGVKSFTAPMNLDMNWMLAYSFADLRGSLSGKYIDFIGSAKWYEIQGNERITYSPIGKDNEHDLIKRVFGGGHLLDDDWIMNNGYFSLNDAIESNRIAAEVIKADTAYGTLLSGYTLTTNYNNTPTAVVDKDIATLNDAGEDMKASIIESNVGVQMSEDSVMLFFVHPSYQGRIDQALNANRGEDGSRTVVYHNIVPVYSRKITAQIGGNDAGLLVLPQQKNIYATFKDMEMNTERDFDSQKSKLGAVEKYSPNVLQTQQVRRVRLSV